MTLLYSNSFQKLFNLLLVGLLFIVSSCEQDSFIKISNFDLSGATVSAPSGLTYSNPNPSYGQNLLITDNTPTLSSGTATSFSIAPAIPTGLSFDTTTGIISGTPSVVDVIGTLFVITATNSAGSTTVNMTISVTAAPAGLVYSAPTVTYGQNVLITNNTPSSTGGAITSYAIAPALSAGLNFNTTTGIISGTPTAVNAGTAYTITATNGFGSDTAIVNITVVALPSGLSYLTSPANYTNGVAITDNTISSSGGAIDSYAIAPALPTGLNLNTTTGTISGTPTVVSAPAAYTITATNPAGTDTVSLTIGVYDALSGLSYSTPSPNYINGVAITDNTPSLTTGIASSYSIAPALSAGLNFNTTTGVISGTPSANNAGTVYTITATNPVGTTNVAMTLTVTIPAPTVALQSPTTIYGIDTTPTIRVSGVANGNTVNLYSDSSCSSLIQTATASGTTHDFTDGPLAVHSHNTYFANRVDGATTSACSSVEVSYIIYDDPAGDMVTVWQTTTPNETITLPLPSGFTYNFTAHWDDGSSSLITSNTDPDITHTFANPGAYAVVLNGTAGAWSFNDSGDKDKLYEVPELGDMGWIDLGSAFYGCTNLTTVAGGDTSSVVNMIQMFRDAPNATPDTSGWNTSNVTNMLSMFWGASVAIPDTSSWDTSNVTSMQLMFRGASLANPDMSGWDTTSLVNTSAMFRDAGSVTATSIATSGNIWNTSNLVDMSAMFSGTALANPDVSGWNTSNVTNMSQVFLNTSSAAPDVSSWVTNNVSNMSNMFANATNAIPTTTTAGNVWNTSNVTDMSEMFSGATSANPDTSGWNTANVENMSSMFSSATSADPDTSSWNTSNVTNMNRMFYGATLANPDVSSWDTSNVTNTGSMFFGAVNATPTTTTIGAIWDTSKVTNISLMFYGASIANPDTSGWDTSNVTTMTTVFYNATLANPDVSGWDTSNVTTMSSLFYNAINANPDVSGWITSNVTNMNSLFQNAPSAIPDVSGWDTSNVTSMEDLFNSATNANPDVSNWNTANVTSMLRMFNGATSAFPVTTTSGLTWNTSNVTDMSGMFYDTNADPDVSGFNMSNVTDISRMFLNATIATPNTSSWDTSNVTDMSLAFQGTAVANPDTSNWNTSKVTDMSYMFFGANSATPITTTSGSVWDTSNVVDMSNMFESADNANPDTSGWDISNVTDLSYMFEDAVSADPDTSSWNFANVIDMTGFFSGVTLPTTSYSDLLNQIDATSSQPGVTLDGGNSEYNAGAAAARASLVGNGWVITDGGAE